MPKAWSTLPIYQLSPPPPDSIEVYEKIVGRQSLVYGGYICPPAPANVPIAALKAPPSRLCKTRCGKYAKLIQMLSSGNVTTERVPEMVSEIQKSKEVLCTTSSGSGQRIKEEDAATSGREPLQNMESSGTDALPQQIPAKSEQTPLTMCDELEFSSDKFDLVSWVWQPPYEQCNPPDFIKPEPE